MFNRGKNTALLSDPSIALYAMAPFDRWQWGLLFPVVALKPPEILPPEPLASTTRKRGMPTPILRYSC
jgi:hypothetical protein